MKWRSRRGKKFLHRADVEIKDELMTPAEEKVNTLLRKYAKKVTGSPYIRVDV